MSKRRNKSRLTKTDVNTICEMQRKIDVYEEYIVGLCGLIQHRGATQYAVLLRNTDMDSAVNQAWNEYKKQMKKKETFDGKCNGWGVGCQRPRHPVITHWRVLEET